MSAEFFNPFAQAITSLMAPDDREDWFRKIKERAGVEKDAEDSIRRNCLEAMELLVTAMRYPRISSQDLEHALRCITLAYNSAREFD